MKTKGFFLTFLVFVFALGSFSILSAQVDNEHTETNESCDDGPCIPLNIYLEQCFPVERRKLRFNLTYFFAHTLSGPFPEHLVARAYLERRTNNGVFQVSLKDPHDQNAMWVNDSMEVNATRHEKIIHGNLVQYYDFSIPMYISDSEVITPTETYSVQYIFYLPNDYTTPYNTAEWTFDYCTNNPNQKSGQFLSEQKPIIQSLYPNPVQDKTILQYELPVSSEVDIKLFNPIGQQIKTLYYTPYQLSGSHMAKLNLQGIPMGTYMVQMKANGILENRKIIIQ